MNLLRYIFFAAAILPQAAQATMTVTLANAGGLYTTNNPTAYYVGCSSNSGDAAIPSCDSVNATVIFDNSIGFPYHAIDVSKTAVTDAALRDRPGLEPFSNMLMFNVTSSIVPAPTVGANQSLVLVMLPDYISNPPAMKFAPMAWANGDCAVGSNCTTTGLAFSDANGNPVNFGAYYTNGQTLTVGFYPTDYCNFADQAAGFSPQGCTTQSLNYRTGTQPIQISFTFQVYLGPTGGTGALTGSPLDIYRVIINFQRSAPIATGCPNLTNFYFPGDGNITVDPARFAGVVATTGSTTIQPNFAPVQQLILVGRPYAGSSPLPPDLSNTYGDTHSVNTVKDRAYVGAGPVQLGGFQNDTQYSVGFLVDDYTGAVAPLSACAPMGPVETSEIPGFLQKSNCFIATAAFRSMDAAPVVMLRSFRDQVLMHTQWGRAFVQGYYRYSPRAALWLVQHPDFRFPVLLALIPIQVIAWLFLHPALLFLAYFFSTATLISFALRESQSPTGVS